MPEGNTASSTARRASVTAGWCALLLAGFAAMSYSAALTKSATADEPLHLVGGFMHRNFRDFSVNLEDPALFGWVAAAPLPGHMLRVDLDSPYYRNIPDEIVNQAVFVWQTLYQTPGNDEQRALNRARLVMTMLGTLLGAVAAWWAYRLAGAAAAVVTAALFAFDPNFLAHAPLVKNDVLLSLCLAALMLAVWRVGRRATLLNLLAMAMLCGAAAGVKFSGVLAAPIVVAAVATRSLLPEAWPFLRWRLEGRGARLLAAAATAVLCGAVAITLLWTVYAFRFAPAADGRLFDMNKLVTMAKIKELMVPRIRAQIEARVENPTSDFSGEISWSEVESHQPALLVRAITWTEQRRLLPQSWLAGFLYTYASTLVRSTYLNGQIQHIGWWYYFPLAMLYKTPLATLLAMGLSIAAALGGKIALGRAQFRMLDGWSASVLAVAPLIYGITAINANLNLGLRHVLPVYPFIYIALGVSAAMVIRRWRNIGMVACAVLCVGVAVESLLARPNYLPFFNAAAGGARGGLKLLGDSNLDWGQDLKLLAQWQRDNPETPLLLSYFGFADPAAYGIRATHVPGGYLFAEQQIPATPGVLAVSATNLQGIYLEPELRPTYRRFAAHQPFAVLGGSIYLYHFPLPPSPANDTAPSAAPGAR